MAEQVLVQFSIDKNLREEVAKIYESLGMDLTTALRMFLIRSKIERGLPFSAKLPEPAISRAEAWHAFEELRKQAADVPEMSLNEINAEISAVSRSRRKKAAHLIFYAVIDTNVILSALLSKKSDTATVKVIKAVMDGKIVPLLHDDILAEYEDVLYRDKFHLSPATIQVVLQAFTIYGMKVTPKKSGENFYDPDDLIFYEVALAKRDNDAYLVTGNQRHYPVRDFIVSPVFLSLNVLNTKNKKNPPT